jgi:hypothetical protein
MALELNGTTGVNLVQDGTVTAADLAAGAARANFGAGAVLQVVTASLSTVTISTASGGLSAYEWGSANITPAAIGNKLVVMTSTACCYATACLGQSNLFVTYSASGVSETIANSLYSGNETSNIRTYDALGVVATVTTTTTNTYTIRIRINGRDVYAAAKSTDWLSANLVVMEIAS